MGLPRRDPRRSARWRRTRSPRRPAGDSYRRPCCARGRTARACASCGSTRRPARATDCSPWSTARSPGPGWKAIAFAEVGEGRTALLVHADDERLRRLAVLDAVINNADRKGGHLLPGAEGRLYGIDHGVTFNAENKLRTLLWGWAGRAPDAGGRRGPDRAEGRAGRGRCAGRAAGGAGHRRRDRGHARAGGRAAGVREASGAQRGVAGDSVAARVSAREAAVGAP